MGPGQKLIHVFPWQPPFPTALSVFALGFAVVAAHSDLEVTTPLFHPTVAGVIGFNTVPSYYYNFKNA